MEQAFEFDDGFACRLSVCQGIQVAIVCLSPDLSIAPKIGDAFAHGLSAMFDAAGKINLSLRDDVCSGTGQSLSGTEYVEIIFIYSSCRQVVKVV